MPWPVIRQMRPTSEIIAELDGDPLPEEDVDDEFEIMDIEVVEDEELDDEEWDELPEVGVHGEADEEE